MYFVHPQVSICAEVMGNIISCGAAKSSATLADEVLGRNICHDAGESAGKVAICQVSEGSWMPTPTGPTVAFILGIGVQALFRLSNMGCRRLWRPVQDDYDCIIRIVSLADFEKSKRIWLLRSLYTDFDPSMGVDVRVISVVGLFNKGKTFLLNKLFGLRLPSGRTQVTQGLSCVYVKDRKMLLIDSPGVQSTVSYRSDSVDRVVDAQSTETFIFELVSQISDHVIFVVNEFTNFEQAKVQSFAKKEKDRSEPAPRELIVVHNCRGRKNIRDADY